MAVKRARPVVVGQFDMPGLFCFTIKGKGFMIVGSLPQSVVLRRFVSGRCIFTACTAAFS